MTGSTRSLHLPAIPDPERDGASAVDVPDLVQAEAPAIVLYGRIAVALKHALQQTHHLPLAESDYHGTLRMILSALVASEANVRTLLKMLDEKGEF